MGRLKITFALVLAGIVGASAQDVNTDYKTIEQVMLNTALMEGVELLHNQQVDTVRKRQEKLMGLTVTYAGLKDLLITTLENAKGFGPESGVYRSIVATSLNIVEHTVKATKAIGDSNLTGKAIASVKVYELMTEAAHLGNLFFDIINNAEVKNPMRSKMEGAAEPTKDKYNLLNRHERLAMALKISMELKKIDRKLVMIDYYCRHNSLSDLLLHVDRQTWVTYHYANFSSKRLIDKWNQLTE